MNSMKTLIARLRSLPLRPPSRRVRERLFGPPPVAAAAAPTSPGWAQAVVPLGATSLCSLLLALWTGGDLTGPPPLMALEIRPGITTTMTALEGQDGHTLWNAAPSRLEWTNKGPSLSSMPSLPQWVTNRLR
jgi:hypothetical protein